MVSERKNSGDKDKAEDGREYAMPFVSEIISYNIHLLTSFSVYTAQFCHVQTFCRLLENTQLYRWCNDVTYIYWSFQWIHLLQHRQ